MPVYNRYGGVAGSFGEGLMQGFNFIDSIMARRQQAEDRKRALAMEDERMRMAREDQAMQREQFDTTQARQREADLQAKRNEGQVQVDRLAAAAGGFDKLTPEGRAQIAAIMRQSDPSRYASADDTQILSEAQAFAAGGGALTANEVAAARKQTEADARAKTRVTGLIGLVNGLQPDNGFAPPPHAVRRGGGPRSAGSAYNAQLMDTQFAAADQMGLPRDLVTKLAFGESSGGANLQNSESTASGPFAITNGTFDGINKQYFGGQLDPASMEHRGYAGLAELKKNLETFGGDQDLALAGYFAGTERVQQLLAAGGKDAVMAYQTPTAGNGDRKTIGDYISYINSQPSEVPSSAPAAPTPAASAAPPTAAPAAPAPRESLLGVSAPATQRRIDGRFAGSQPQGKTGFDVIGDVVKGVGRASDRVGFRAALDPNNPAGNSIRSQPVKFYADYMDARDGLSALERTKVDGLMYDGLTAELNKAAEDLRGGNKAAATRVLDLKSKVADLNKVRASEKIRADVPRAVPPGDNAAAALTNAVETRQGDTPTMTEAGARGLGTRVDRLLNNPPRRLTAAQLDLLAEGVVGGFISLQQAQNFAQYQQFDKAAVTKPTVMSVEGGLAVVTDAGIQFVQSPFTKGKGGAGGYDGSEARLRSAANLKVASDILQGKLDSGGIDPFGRNPSHATVFGDYLQTKTRFAPQLERLGIRMTEPGSDGKRVSSGQYDEGTEVALANAFAEYGENELYATVKDGHDYPWYVAKYLGMDPDAATARGAPAKGDRFQVGGVTYEYDGVGDPNNRASYKEVR